MSAQVRVCLWRSAWRPIQSHIPSPGVSWTASWETRATTSSPRTVMTIGGSHTRLTLCFTLVLPLGWEYSVEFGTVGLAAGHSSMRNTAENSPQGFQWNNNCQIMNGFQMTYQCYAAETERNIVLCDPSFHNIYVNKGKTEHDLRVTWTWAI